MDSFKAAAVQLNSQPDLNRNMEQIYLRLKEAAEAGASFACLPENFAFFGNDREQLRQAKSISERVETSLSEWARELRLFVLAGGYPVPAGDGKVFNRTALFAPDGSVPATYHKIHLFDVTLSESEQYRESDIMQPGDAEAVVVNTDQLGRIGLSICYDLRFPELYRAMADQRVDVITVPAAFTKTTGEVHWEPLLRARAIENQCYVIAPAQTGAHGEKRETWGHSLIIDPWGEVLTNGGTEPGLITAEINPERISEVRRNLPSLQHRVMGPA